MKKFFLVLVSAILLNFVGCGSSSEEAKALQRHNLKLVGIPQEIVVNICQDTNSNGSCDEGEFQAKIRVNADDSIAKMWEKVNFEADGRYILENYDPTLNIIMEIDGSKVAKYNNVDLSLTYKPTTRELSVLQAVVDADFLKEEDVSKLKKLDNRDEIDRVLFKSLTKNQSLLEEQNLTKKTALIINLEEIAKGLIDSNVSKELPEQLEACANNNTCIERLVNNTSNEVEITEEEAVELARSKNVADGYIVKLTEPVVAVCANGKEYNSSLIVGEKGKIDFNAFPVGTECNITVPKGAIIDSNNNGIFDDKDKPLEFEMIGSADDNFITPLTTLLFKKKKNGENVTKFASMIQNFNPVTAPSRTLTNSGVEKVKLEKLIVLMEILKTSMKNSVDISKLDLSGVVTTGTKDNINNLNIEKLIGNFPEELKSTILEKTGKIKQILNILKTLDIKKVSINSFVIAVSDGGKGIKNALTSSLYIPLPDGVAILDFVANSSNSNNIKPIAKAGKDQNISIGDKVVLDASQSSDSDGEIKSYEWWDTAKDKLLGSGLSITLTNLALGVHRISLFVKDEKGAISKDVIFIYVNKKSIIVNESDYFITKWKTDNNGTSANNQISIPTNGGGYDYFVDWGDGNFNNGVTGDINHTYSSVGTYTVKISGSFPAIYFHDNFDTDIISDAKKLLSIEQWGTIKWYSMESAFQGCSNMTGNYLDKPDLSNVYSLHAMFSEASSFNQDIGDWNTSSITDMGYMFSGATTFNQDISDWNTSNVRRMGTMFQSATSFNQNIGNWDVSNVTSISSMFYKAENFNQDIGRWSVSNVIIMSGVFSEASSFNQDIGNWDVSNVVYMGEMFYHAGNFNQNLASWNISKVTDMRLMFDFSTTLSTSNYDALLIAWSTLTLENNVTFHVGNSQYSQSASTARKNIIDNFGWTIIDGDQEVDNVAPAIPIVRNQPPVYTTYDNISIIINGEVASNISVNGNITGKIIGADGNGSISLSLYNGENNFSITLIDASGNESLAITFSITKTGLFTLKKTGQTKSYDVDGNKVLDKSQKDDGFYQKGVDVNYTRDSDKEIVIDHLTGLMWQDDSAVASVQKPWVIQENWDAGDYNNTLGDTANAYCNELVLGGYEDWRLPTIVELQNIVNDEASNPAMDIIFINVYNSNYWSSTTNHHFHYSAWVVLFGYGSSSHNSKNRSFYVRCVREGK